MPDERLPPDCDWLAHYGLSRRTVLAGTAAGLGFAAACQPVSATTKITSSEGIDTASATVKAADGFAVPVYVARPKTRGPLPVIIVVHEIFGVHQWIKDICRRLAHEGYMAVAPDLFARAGDATKVADIPTLFQTIVAKTPDAQVLSDIDRTAAWADGHGGAAGKTGITGFCWGGRVVWLYAAHSAALKAGVAYYGRLKGEQPIQPLQVAGKLKAPVLGQYGGRDHGIPLSDVEAMNKALGQAGGKSRITVYPEADHGFMADYRPSYNEQAAKASWAAMLDWFGKTLGRT
ncbi:MAG TPA: dienelactone hydrolase family protein [Sphingobium sp.]|nr:dienelactone hydrolase family protein [Sphingobium sp.]